MLALAFALLGMILSFLAVFVWLKQQRGAELEAARKEAATIKRAAEISSQTVKTQAETRLRDEILTERHREEDALRARFFELDNKEEKLSMVQAEVEAEIKVAEESEEEIAARGKKAQSLLDRSRGLEDDVKRRGDQVREALETQAGYSGETVKERLMQTWIEDAKADAAQLLRTLEHAGTDPEYGRAAKRLMDLAFGRYSGHFLTERAISNIPILPPVAEILLSDGERILQAIGAGSNVTLHMSDNKDAVRLEGLDGVGREIARRAVAALGKKESAVADAKRDSTHWIGRIKQTLDEEIQSFGKRAFSILEIPRPHAEIVTLVGKLNWRTSYTQNQWLHAVEASFICGMIAAEMGLDEKLARRATLMHDIGKALTHEIDGSHAVIGADIARRLGEAEIVANAIGAHHADEPPNSIYAYLVAAADAMSGARPGARREHTDGYSSRLSDLERIGGAHRGVDRAFAVHGGRELRVYVRDDQVTDLGAVDLSAQIAAQISDEMTFPGQIKVTVIRSTEAVAVAN